MERMGKVDLPTFLVPISLGELTFFSLAWCVSDFHNLLIHQKIFPACFLRTGTGSTREALAPVQLLDFSVAEVLGHLAGRGRAGALSGKPEVHSQGFSFNYLLIWGGLRCSFFSEDLKRV